MHCDWWMKVEWQASFADLGLRRSVFYSCGSNVGGLLSTLEFGAFDGSALMLSRDTRESLACAWRVGT